jgi:hypothetical protein
MSGISVPRDVRPVDVEQPLVSKHLDPHHKNNSVGVGSRHPNPTLLDLGIVLLELYFGQPIEQKRQPEDLAANGHVHANTDLYTARNWLDESYQTNMSLRYWSAVKHCIDYVFQPMPRSLDLLDETFREAVYTKVVLPLEEELHDWEQVI